MIIQKVVDPKNWDAPIQGAELEQMIKLVGKNLNNADTITINDVGVSMPGDAMIVNGEIYIRIPYSAPTVIDNKIKITDIYNRTVEYDNFVISLPKMTATGMDLEWAAPGTDVTFYGNYFDLYRMTDEDESKVLFGTNEATIVNMTKTLLTVTVPAGAAPNDEIKLQSVTGETVKMPFKYRDQQWLLNDFTAKNGEVHGGFTYQNAPAESGDPNAIDGTYLKYKANFPGGWSADGWGVLDMWVSDVAGKLPDDINTNRNKYSFKFEAWAALEPIKVIRFEFESWDPNETRCWWYDVELFPEPVIGKWHTVTLPAESIISSIGGIGTIKCFRIVAQGPDAGEVYLAIDNPRFALK